jgi:hypothetical protein
MYGIKVGGWSGSRTACARAANRTEPPYLRAGDGLFSHSGRRVPMAGMGASGVLTTFIWWEMGGENLFKWGKSL